MEIVNFLVENGPWSWIVGGLVLLALELVLPGGFLLWMGIAGILTGIITLFQPLAWPMQWLIFGVFSLVSIYAWVRLTKHRAAQTDRPLLNQRTEHFVGREVVLDQPIIDGFGRVRMGDTKWRVSGPDLPAGQRVRVIGSEGAVLQVEPV